MFTHIRRNSLKVIAASAMALFPIGKAAFAESKEPRPEGSITVRLTAADKRYALADPLRWHRASGKVGTNTIVILPARKQQPILGFGAALTDAACYMINQMPEADRDKLLQELFDPKQMGFSLCRLCIGSSDYAKTMYSFDEGDPDPELTRFSIDHDRAYILPIVRRSREINPDLYLFASPWSPPGWMKDNNAMFGGTIRAHYLPAYANYFVKFLQAYKDAGVEINSVSSQNEVDTDQDSKMPACLFPQEIEVRYVGQNLGPALESAGLKTKIWLLDHNYNLWGRALSELDEPEVNKYTKAIAWHGYLGKPEWVEKVLAVHPDAEMYWTEGGQHFDDEDYATCWSKWGSKFTDILRNGMRGIIGWNMALDETGKPNIGPYKCAGLVTINSQTREVTRSGQFWAFAHFTRAMQRNAEVIGSEGDVASVQHVAAVNPDGQYVVVLTNSGKTPTTVQLRDGSSMVKVDLPADSVTTLIWK
ncbi:MAG TPA: glycoside hydrolase family 30 beta sandwich domain-containing protein [Verrucomicrobiae bacterium]|nr:glycoside hydrolase family 30 beta sandwich domain-containing protein [Verrucomicrobiae bacterium]